MSAPFFVFQINEKTQNAWIISGYTLRNILFINAVSKVHRLKSFDIITIVLVENWVEPLLTGFWLPILKQTNSSTNQILEKRKISTREIICVSLVQIHFCPIVPQFLLDFFFKSGSFIQNYSNKNNFRTIELSWV